MNSESMDPRAVPALMPTSPLFDPDAAMTPNPEPEGVGRIYRAVRIVFALWLFLSAIALLKDGAAALAPLLDGSALTDSRASTLGFGWLGAMLVMSGSPIAVSAIALLDGGVVDKIGAFTMLTGSRLGASLVVLVVAFVYAMRTAPGTGVRKASLSIGIFALTLSAIVYLPAMLIATPMLENDVFGSLLPTDGIVLPDVVSAVTAPFVDLIADVLPGRALFLVGLVLLLFSVRIIDRALPEATDAARLDEHRDWRSRKWVMFGVGSLVALVTMSVSVALTVLVPAVAKGHFRRRQTIPYIMGANITTLGDTLLTAVIIGGSDGVEVVLTELVAITAITLLLLVFFYRPLTEALVRFTDWMLSRRRHVVGFCLALFIVPIVLIVLP
jgi:sodium-dependent phosphate cotransporter